MREEKRRSTHDTFVKERMVNVNSGKLPEEDHEILRKARDGLAFDNLDENNGKGNGL